MEEDFILKLYSRSETVFSVNDVSMLFPKITYESLRDRLYYFTKIGKLKRLRHGIYAKNEYEPFELANKVYKPSYISLQTVLVKEGLIFQYYETIFLTSYLTRNIKMDNITIQYQQIKKDILVNTDGIEQKTGYYIASAERAFLDAIYIYKNYHFDNLRGLNWKKIMILKDIYQSQRLEQRLKEYYQIYQQQNA